VTAKVPIGSLRTPEEVRRALLGLFESLKQTDQTITEVDGTSTAYTDAKSVADRAYADSQDSAQGVIAAAYADAQDDLHSTDDRAYTDTHVNALSDAHEASAVSFDGSLLSPVSQIWHPTSIDDVQDSLVTLIAEIDGRIEAGDVDAIIDAINGWNTGDSQLSNPSVFQTGLIVADAIASGAVVTSKLAANSVTSAKVVAGSIDASHIASGSITSDKIVAGSITADKIDSDAIQSSNFTMSGGVGVFAGAGTFLDLSNGVIQSKNMIVDANGVSANAFELHADGFGKVAEFALNGFGSSGVGFNFQDSFTSPTKGSGLGTYALLPEAIFMYSSGATGEQASFDLAHTGEGTWMITGTAGSGQGKIESDGTSLDIMKLSGNINITSSKVNFESDTGSQTIAIGEWSSGSNHAAIESPSMYILMGNSSSVNSSNYIRSKGTGTLHLGVNGSNDLWITDGGAVNTVGAVNVAGALTANGQIKTVQSGSDQLRLQNTTSTTAGPYISLYHSTGRIGYMGFPNNDDLHLKNESSGGHIYLSTNSATRMMVNSSGNVGIGTTSPNQKLYVEGNTTVTGRIYNGVGTLAAPSYSFNGDTNTGIFRKANGHLGISCNGTQHYFTNAGLYLASGDWFRSTGDAGWYSQTYGGGIYMTDTTWVKTYGGKGMYPQGGFAILGPNTTTTYSGYQDLLWNTTWTSVHRYSSKRSMKEQIEPLNASVDAGAVIDLLKPVSFIAAPNPDNEEPETPAEKEMREADLVWGFVAEDVCEIDETVGARLGVYEPSEDGDGFQPAAWAQRAFFPLLVAELQALRKRVAALEAASETKMFY